MKVWICLCVITAFQSCISMVVKKSIINYKLNDSTEIELQYVGGGATAPNYLIMFKKNLTTNLNTTIKVLNDYTDENVFHLNKVNDSIISLNIVDTAKFTAIPREHNFFININEIDTTLNIYK